MLLLQLKQASALLDCFTDNINVSYINQIIITCTDLTFQTVQESSLCLFLTDKKVF